MKLLHSKLVIAITLPILCCIYVYRYIPIRNFILYLFVWHSPYCVIVLATRKPVLLLRA